MTGDETVTRFSGSPQRSAHQRPQGDLRQSYENRQTAVEERAAEIKEQHSDRLEKAISVAGEDDADIRALAVDQLARSVAQRGSSPERISGEDWKRLTDRSLQEAYKIHEASQEKQQSVPSPAETPQPLDPLPDMSPRNVERDYGVLQQAHEQVAAAEEGASTMPEEQTTDAGVSPVEQQATSALDGAADQAGQAIDSIATGFEGLLGGGSSEAVSAPQQEAEPMTPQREFNAEIDAFLARENEQHDASMQEYAERSQQAEVSQEQTHQQEEDQGYGGHSL